MGLPQDPRGTGRPGSASLGVDGAGDLEEGRNRSRATADWAGKQSGRAGRATLLRVFERGGMPCGEVEHVFTAGGGNRYVLPFCRTGDGTWKVAF